MFPGQHQLGIGERNRGRLNLGIGGDVEVRMIFAEATERFRTSGLVGLEEVFGLFPELLQIRPRG